MRKSEKLIKFGGVIQIVVSTIIILLEIFKICGIENLNFVKTPFHHISNDFKNFLSVWIILVSIFQIFVGVFNVRHCSNFKTASLQIVFSVLLLFSKSFSSDIITTLATTCTLTGALIKNRTAKKNISSNEEGTIKENL